MKKAKIKSLVKAARKTAKESIATKVVTDLTAFTAELGQSSKKLSKEIKKGANQLAKKISKEIKIDKAAFADADNDIPPTKSTKSTKVLPA